MKIIEKVKMNRTVQFGRVVHVKGKVLEGPDITQDVLDECESGSGFVTVLASRESEPAPPASEMKVKVKPETVTVKKKAPAKRRPRRKPASKKK